MASYVTYILSLIPWMWYQHRRLCKALADAE